MVSNTKKLPTWCETPPPVRHKLLGELIDAMIYSGEAMYEVELLVDKFHKQKLVKSIILPLENNNDETNY